MTLTSKTATTNMVERMAADEGPRHDTRLDEQSTRYSIRITSTWLGVPIIQFPQDLVALQEIIALEPDRTSSSRPASPAAGR